MVERRWNMKLFHGLKNSVSKPEVETIGLNPTLAELERFFNCPIETLSTSMLTSATYYACMQIRCNAIAKLPIKLMRQTEDGTVENKTERISQLLKKRPNGYSTPHDFIWATEFQRLEYGNAFWLISTSYGGIIALYLLDSRNMEVVVDNTCILDQRSAVYYLYHDSKNGEQIYTSDEIVHFKNFTTNGILGVSIKKYLSDTINNEKMANQVVKDKYKNGLQDPVVVQYIGDLNETKQQKIRKKFSDMGGAKHAGKVIPIPTDFKIEQLSTKLVNNQFFELQGLTAKQIANGFGVKGFQLNDMEQSTYHNIEQQNKAFYSDTLQNALIAYEQEMDYKLLTGKQKGQDFYFKFNADAMLRSDIVTRYQAHQIGISSGFLTIAEARTKENLPYKEGTDELIIGNGASLPLTDLGNQQSKGGENVE